MCREQEAFGKLVTSKEHNCATFGSSLVHRLLLPPYLLLIPLLLCFSSFVVVYPLCVLLFVAIPRYFLHMVDSSATTGLSSKLLCSPRVESEQIYSALPSRNGEQDEVRVKVTASGVGVTVHGINGSRSPSFRLKVFDHCLNTIVVKSSLFNKLINFSLLPFLSNL